MTHPLFKKIASLNTLSPQQKFILLCIEEGCMNIKEVHEMTFLSVKVVIKTIKILRDHKYINVFNDSHFNFQLNRDFFSNYTP